MEPVFPNSAVVRAPERFVLKGGRWSFIDLAVRYGVFEHPRGGRCLVDTGYSRRTLHGQSSTFLKLYASILRPRLTSDALPEARPDVNSILLTHLHTDHVSALHDYPDTDIYADGQAVEHFLSCGWRKRIGHGVFTELLPDDLAERIRPYESLPQVEAPHGLGQSADVFGDGSVLAVPLPGHMRGHTGILWPKLETPLLYAADAEWLSAAWRKGLPPGPPARWILNDVSAARETAAKILAFEKAGGRVVLCHDPEPL